MFEYLIIFRLNMEEAGGNKIEENDLEWEFLEIEKHNFIILHKMDV